MKFPIPPQYSSQLYRAIAFVALGATLSLVFGCSKAKREPIRIGINPWPGYEFIYLAKEMGFFEAERVNVQVLEFTSLGDTRRAFERGQLDGMGGTLAELLEAWEQSDRSPQAIYVCDFSNGGDVILTQPEIHNVAGLKGKRVGIESGSLNTFVLARALEKHGLDLEDISLMAMSQIHMEKAFRSHEIDAAVTYPPISINILNTSKANQVFSTRNIPGEVLDILAIDQSTIAEREEDIVRIIRAFDRAVQYSKEHPEDAYRIMAEREGISAEEFRIAIEEGIHMVTLQEQGPFFEPGGKLETAIKYMDQVMRKVGQLKGTDHTADCVASQPVARASAK